MRALFNAKTRLLIAATATALVLVACSAMDTLNRSTGATATPGAASTPAAAGTSGTSGAQAAAAYGRPTTNARAASGSTNPAAIVYRETGASVVNITSIAVVRTRAGLAEAPQGIGSGFMIDADGRIATNNHVVRDADQLTVTFQDKTTTPAKLLGRDPDNDLAVIQVDPNAQDDQGRVIRDQIKPVSLANSDDVIIGDTAIAIGSPLGLRQTVTEGIVSARREPGDDSPMPGAELDLLGGAIQTDAAINPGNSGGPLFNASGQVIGINSAILSQSGGNEGIGFAIPTNVLTRVAPELIQTGQYRHPFLGVTTIPLAQMSAPARQQLGIDPKLKGLLVVEATGPAAQAGIQGGRNTVTIGGQQIPTGGDIITAVDGHQVVSGGDLRGYIENNKRPGDSVTVTVVRGGQRQDVQVTLGERPPAPQQPQR